LLVVGQLSDHNKNVFEKYKIKCSKFKTRNTHSIQDLKHITYGRFRFNFGKYFEVKEHKSAQLSTTKYQYQQTICIFYVVYDTIIEL